MDYLTTLNPILIISSVSTLLIFALLFVASQFFSESRSRSNVRKRLNRPKVAMMSKEESKHRSKGEERKELSSKVARKANDFYVSSDPDSVKRIRMQLMQAGFMQPNAVGYFIAARFGAAAVSALLGLLIVFLFYADKTITYKITVLVFMTSGGYFFPNMYLNRKIKNVEISNRQGFPDILDLMVVSAEAGLTMEASIERIAGEIKHTYPHLSAQLNMAALEIRAGRPIDQALRAFGDRLRLDEVKGFATMVQQAKELGTSVSDALRVYSEEMRHKRMMQAEEKAYALPAKMSVPVTLFILPIVVGIAVVPTIVRFNL